MRCNQACRFSHGFNGRDQHEVSSQLNHIGALRRLAQWPDLCTHCLQRGPCHPHRHGRPRRQDVEFGRLRHIRPTKHWRGHVGAASLPVVCRQFPRGFDRDRRHIDVDRIPTHGREQTMFRHDLRERVTIRKHGDQHVGIRAVAGLR